MSESASRSDALRQTVGLGIWASCLWSRSFQSCAKAQKHCVRCVHRCENSGSESVEEGCIVCFTWVTTAKDDVVDYVLQNPLASLKAAEPTDMSSPWWHTSRLQFKLTCWPSSALLNSSGVQCCSRYSSETPLWQNLKIRFQQ